MVLVLSILVGIITAIPSSGLNFLIGMFVSHPNHFALSQILSRLVEHSVQIITQPIILIGITVLSYDLRIRNEGYDMEFQMHAQAQSIGVDRPSPGDL